MRGLYLVGLVYIAISAVALYVDRRTLGVQMAEPIEWVASDPLPVAPMPVHQRPEVPLPEDARSWFSRIRPSCNAVEAELAMRETPPPTDLDGTGYGAACWGLAGKIDKARASIMTLEQRDRWRAVGIVFEVGHPIADMGDDLAAGPIMELTVEFWPNHYMALYHAGAARFNMGQFPEAQSYLLRFLEHYNQNDGWTSSAHTMLTEIKR